MPVRFDEMVRTGAAAEALLSLLLLVLTTSDAGKGRSITKFVSIPVQSAPHCWMPASILLPSVRGVVKSSSVRVVTPIWPVATSMLSIST